MSYNFGIPKKGPAMAIVALASGTFPYAPYPISPQTLDADKFLQESLSLVCRLVVMELTDVNAVIE